MAPCASPGHTPQPRVFKKSTIEMETDLGTTESTLFLGPFLLSGKQNLPPEGQSRLEFLFQFYVEAVVFVNQRTPSYILFSSGK